MTAKNLSITSSTSSRSMISYFSSSILLTILGLATAFYLGGIATAWIVLILAILETSLSFENAIVNTAVLKDMDAVWRKRFLVWGMFIAVFVMRIVFPLLIVGIVGQIGPVEVVNMALFDKEQYKHILESAHVQIAAFGGSFLLMVFFKYFLDYNKEEDWLKFIERPLKKLGKIEAVEIGLSLLVLILTTTFIDAVQEKMDFIIAGIWGIVTYILVDSIGGLLESEEEHKSTNTGVSVAKQGLSAFLYLEVLDASFSFDGVIGAFSLSNDLIIIAIGLGIGAMFVRSFTLLLVDKGTLNTYKYLEHGAFWAIGVLAAIMFIGVFQHIPEWVTGLLGALFIGVSFIHSVKVNKN